MSCLDLGVVASSGEHWFVTLFGMPCSGGRLARRPSWPNANRAFSPTTHALGQRRSAAYQQLWKAASRFLGSEDEVGPRHWRRRLCRRACLQGLGRARYLAVVIDNLSTGHASFVRWGPLIEADIRDAAAIASALGSYRIDAVLHLPHLPVSGNPSPIRRNSMRTMLLAPAA